MENAESAVRRPRMSIWIYIVAFVVIIALAAGIYFIFIAGGNKEPRRGTYVLNGNQEVIKFEQGYQQT